MVKTHTFRLGKYDIEEARRIDGVCDVPGEGHGMLILDGNDFKALNSALHEAMHAEGIPDRYLHDSDGCSDTERLARFLWRLGYRKGNNE
jgi:hypothetical protein